MLVAEVIPVSPTSPLQSGKIYIPPVCYSNCGKQMTEIRKLKKIKPENLTLYDFVGGLEDNK